ncbi:MAG: hypothetical protein WAL26_11900, partial [Mycobacterium sp.]
MVEVRDLGGRGDCTERAGGAGRGDDRELGSSREHCAEGRFEHHPHGVTGRRRRAADRQLSKQRHRAFEREHAMTGPGGDACDPHRKADAIGVDQAHAAGE